MKRENLAEAISVLLALYGPESGYLEYKEGSDIDPGTDFDKVIEFGWVSRTDQGGPWRKVEITPKGTELIERFFRETGVSIDL